MWIRRTTRVVLALVLLAGAFYAADGALWVFARTRLLGARARCQLTGKGFTVTYFSDTNLSARVCSRLEPRLHRDYAQESPAWGVPRDHFSARWEGWVVCPNDAEYRFFSQSDDGLRMWIDDVLVLDSWRAQRWPQSATHGLQRLAKGPHRIVVEYYDGLGNAVMRVKWAGGGIDDNTVMSRKHVLIKNPSGGAGLEK